MAISLLQHEKNSLCSMAWQIMCIFLATFSCAMMASFYFGHVWIFGAGAHGKLLCHCMAFLINFSASMIFFFLFNMANVSLIACQMYLYGMTIYVFAQSDFLSEHPLMTSFAQMSLMLLMFVRSGDLPKRTSACSWCPNHIRPLRRETSYDTCRPQIDETTKKRAQWAGPVNMLTFFI